MEFRTLKANEIECRVGTLSEKGCSLLLYKDARVDMSLLDEVVGAENWQRNHELVNGNLFCNVGIKVNNEWIWKQDVGTESATEAEKGQASDSFKRACVNWGIGRELYTAPFIWIEPNDAGIYKDDKGKLRCKNRFYVKSIEYDKNRIIKGLAIANEKTNKLVYSMHFDDVMKPEAKAEAKPKTETKSEANKAVEYADLKTRVLAYVNNNKVDAEALAKTYKVKSLQDMNTAQLTHYISFIEKQGGTI